MAREFIIQPNCSLSSRGRKVFLGSMAMIMLAISLGMASLGLWLVAPFMGLELLVLIYVFNLVGKQCHIIERVIIRKDQLTVQHEEEKNPNTWSFPLHWVSVELRVAKHPWYKSQLVVGAYGRWVEFAKFLNNDERASLAEAIQSAIISERQPDWSKV